MPTLLGKYADTSHVGPGVPEYVYDVARRKSVGALCPDYQIRVT